MRTHFLLVVSTIERFHLLYSHLLPLSSFLHTVGLRGHGQEGHALHLPTQHKHVALEAAHVLHDVGGDHLGPLGVVMPVPDKRGYHLHACVQGGAYDNKIWLKF